MNSTVLSFQNLGRQGKDGKSEIMLKDSKEGQSARRQDSGWASGNRWMCRARREEGREEVKETKGGGSGEVGEGLQ